MYEIGKLQIVMNKFLKCANFYFSESMRNKCCIRELLLYCRLCKKTFDIHVILEEKHIQI